MQANKGMKKLLPVVGVLILIGVGVFVLLTSKTVPQDLLGEDPKLHLYTVSGESTGQLNLTVPFNEASDEAYLIDVALDLDGDGQIAESEWQIKNAGAYLVQNLKNNYWLIDESKKLAVSGEILVLIHLKKSNDQSESAKLEKKLAVEAFEIGEKFGFDVAGSHEDIKRGIGLPRAITSVAYAEGEEVFRDANTPDLAQDRMECAAVSAANNLMSLAGENDKLDNLPEFTGDLIEELKIDMKFNNGISLVNMVAGKNTFTQRHNLPISTELKLAPTKEDILAALNSGAAVELSFAFVRSASGRANTGHVVTLVGASQSQIFVHDSGTPEGMDTLRMFGTVQTPKNTFINVPYPLWDGVAYIDGIVIQNWTEPKHASGSYTDDGEEVSEVEMLVIDGHYFPKSFFRVAGPDNCNASHYHAANSDDTVYGFKDKNSSEIVSLRDPNRNSCGFGKVSEVPVEKITITFEQSQELIKYLPASAVPEKSGGTVKVCGLPGGPACPPR